MIAHLSSEGIEHLLKESCLFLKEIFDFSRTSISPWISDQYNM